MSPRLFVLAAVVAAALGIPASSSAATATLGPPSLGEAATYFECSNCQSYRLLNTAPPAGARLTSPTDGTVTSWRIVGNVLGGTVQLVVLRPNADGSFSEGAESAAASSFDGKPNPASIQVAAGDTISLLANRNCCPFDPGDHVLVGKALAPGAAWAELGLSSAGHIQAPPTFTGGQELLYNAAVELLPPSLSGISPNSGGGGTSVTIAGQHLAVATGVTFGGVPATIVSADDSRVVALAPPRPQGGAVDVQVKTAGGTSPSTPIDLFTYDSSSPVPALSKLRIAPRAFQALPRGGSIASSSNGSQVSYRLSAVAETAFSVERRLWGRRVGRHCLAPNPENMGKTKCPRFKTRHGQFKRSGVIGLNRFSFSGRLRHKPLPPGAYRLVAVAKDSAGTRSNVARATFEILP